jgi:hypothetical protein
LELNPPFRNRPLSAEQCRVNRTKSKVRAKVEHPFLVIKRIFGFTKVRYRSELYSNLVFEGLKKGGVSG